jgi:hypothetical protein
MLGNPASDAGRLVAQLDNSWCVPYDDSDAILKILQTSLNSAHTAGDFNRADLSRFERKTLTQDLAAALDGIAG